MERGVKRRSSILKPAKSRAPLGELQQLGAGGLGATISSGSGLSQGEGSDDGVTATATATTSDQTTVTRTRRVSFSATKGVALFTSDHGNTIWHDIFEVSNKPEMSDNSITNSIGQQVNDLASDNENSNKDFNTTFANLEQSDDDICINVSAALNSCSGRNVTVSLPDIQATFNEPTMIDHTEALINFKICANFSANPIDLQPKDNYNESDISITQGIPVPLHEVNKLTKKPSFKCDDVVSDKENCLMEDFERLHRQHKSVPSHSTPFPSKPAKISLLDMAEEKPKSNTQTQVQFMSNTIQTTVSHGQNKTIVESQNMSFTISEPQQTGNKSLVQQKTIIFDENNPDFDMSMTMIEEPDEVEVDRRKTLLFNPNVPDSNMSMTCAIPNAHISAKNVTIHEDISIKRSKLMKQSNVIENNRPESNNMSMTMPVQPLIDFSEKPAVLEQTQLGGNMSMTSALPTSQSVYNLGHPAVLERTQMGGNMSMTSVLPTSQSIFNPGHHAVLERTQLGGNMSMTCMIPEPVHNKNKTIVFEQAQLGSDMSMTNVIPSNPKRKSILFNPHQPNSDMSMTCVIPQSQASTKSANHSNVNMSMTEVAHKNIIVSNPNIPLSSFSESMINLKPFEMGPRNSILPSSIKAQILKKTVSVSKPPILKEKPEKLGNISLDSILASVMQSEKLSQTEESPSVPLSKDQTLENILADIENKDDNVEEMEVDVTLSNFKANSHKQSLLHIENDIHMDIFKGDSPILPRLNSKERLEESVFNEPEVSPLKFTDKTQNVSEYPLNEQSIFETKKSSTTMSITGIQPLSDESLLPEQVPKCPTLIDDFELSSNTMFDEQRKRDCGDQSHMSLTCGAFMINKSITSGPKAFNSLAMKSFAMENNEMTVDCNRDMSMTMNKSSFVNEEMRKMMDLTTNQTVSEEHETSTACEGRKSPVKDLSINRSNFVDEEMRKMMDLTNNQTVSKEHETSTVCEGRKSPMKDLSMNRSNFVDEEMRKMMNFTSNQTLCDEIKSPIKEKTLTITTTLCEEMKIRSKDLSINISTFTNEEIKSPIQDKSLNKAADHNLSEKVKSPTKDFSMNKSNLSNEELRKMDLATNQTIMEEIKSPIRNKTLNEEINEVEKVVSEEIKSPIKDVSIKECTSNKTISELSKSLALNVDNEKMMEEKSPLIIVNPAISIEENATVNNQNDKSYAGKSLLDDTPTNRSSFVNERRRKVMTLNPDSIEDIPINLLSQEMKTDSTDNESETIKKNKTMNLTSSEKMMVDLDIKHEICDISDMPKSFYHYEEPSKTLGEYEISNLIMQKTIVDSNSFQNNTQSFLIHDISVPVEDNDEEMPDMSQKSEDKPDLESDNSNKRISLEKRKSDVLEERLDEEIAKKAKIDDSSVKLTHRFLSEDIETVSSAFANQLESKNNVSDVEVDGLIENEDISLVDASFHRTISQESDKMHTTFSRNASVCVSEVSECGNESAEVESFSKLKELTLTEIIENLDLDCEDCQTEVSLSDEWSFLLFWKTVRLKIKFEKPIFATSNMDEPICSISFNELYMEKPSERRDMFRNLGLKMIIKYLEQHSNREACRKSGDLPEFLKNCAKISEDARNWCSDMYYYYTIFGADLNMESLEFNVLHPVKRRMYHIQIKLNGLPHVTLDSISVKTIFSDDKKATGDQLKSRISTIGNDWNCLPQIIEKFNEIVKNMD